MITFYIEDAYFATEFACKLGLDLAGLDEVANIHFFH